MHNYRHSSIKRKLTWINMLVSSAALIVAAAAFAAYELTAFRVTMLRSLSIQAQIVGANSASALLFGDTDSARKTLSALNAAPHIVSAGIYTSAGEPFAIYWRDREGVAPPLPAVASGQTEAYWITDHEMALVRSIVLQDKLIGKVYIRSDLQEVRDRLERYAVIVAAVLGISLLAAFVFSSMFQRTTARPIVQLAETARIVSREKKYSLRARVTSAHDEIAILIEAFNEMLAQIQERDAALQQLNQELERRVAERTSELEATNKELEAFTYSVAHDLRAPVRHIQGFSEALTEDFGPQLDPAATELLTRIVASTRHMGCLIDDLLSLAHVGRQELRLQVTGLNSLVQEVLRDLAHETEGRDIQWRVGDLPFVDCDPGLMRQVLYNLLANAAKYSRPRNPAIIEAGQIAQAGQPVIFIRDNGVGFNMKYAGKLFGVFQRLHRREDFEGTGVGLATVQRIIQKHGGRIWAEAEIDKGATFFFNIGGGLEINTAKPLSGGNDDRRGE